MEDNTIKDLVSDMLSNIVLGDKPEEEQVTSTGLMSSLPGIRTPTQVQQQDEQEAAPKARDKVKEFILRLSDEAEDTNRLRYSEKDAPEITDVMVDSETLLNRYDTPLYVYARNLRDYNPERSTIKVRNRGDHSERFLDQMYELARQSSEEAALARMEMGITESLPRSAPRMGFDVQGLIDAVNKDMTLGVETEELDDEEVAILSDTDIDTDDADGGAAPSDGKGLMSPSLYSDTTFSPIEEAIKQRTKEFYLNIGKKAESDHGSVPKPTKDKAEANIPEAERSKDVGFGHKVKPAEDASGMIHGIKFKNEDGTYIELTDEQKIEILNKDMAYELSLARKDNNAEEGWDSKLEKIGITWDELDYKYQNALTSLAYNVGGIKAGNSWTKVLQAAKDRDVVEFAKQMRRKDSGEFTAGMDNRVAKELYYAGIISSLEEVSSVLPKANYRVAGIPKRDSA